MLFAAICTDKPGSLDKRKANRPEHLAYLKSLGEALVLAGPFTEEDGTSMNGSLIVIEAASLDDARKIIGGDPFAKAGIFANVEIRPWLWSINRPSK
jgi:uncharacterized protein YciI